MKYIPVIGLEVHIELNTKSKMFCGCDNNWFGATPNTHTCPVCLGLPGALPVPNKKAIEGCIKIGMALNCTIPLLSKFDRKNYFYPDLAKGYQISQYDQPFAEHGWINIKRHPERSKRPFGEGSTDSGGSKHELDSSASPQNDMKKIGITRAHMEEDTGKLMHATEDGEKVSLIDFNRSGSPLVEIVTEPDFESAEEVKEYLQKLQQIVRYLGVADADMEKGGMRLEPNISLREISGKGEALSVKNLPKYKVEVKNINSFNFVVDAIEYETKRQTELLDKGETPKQETRGWDEDKHMTISQRSKEEAADYRYFPEPDIPPFIWTKEYLEDLRKEIPELPDARQKRFEKEYGLSEYNAQQITRSKELADYFEEAIRACHPERSEGSHSVNKDSSPFAQNDITPVKIANTIINKKVDIEKVLPAKLIEDLKKTEITNEISAEDLSKVLQPILQQNEKPVADYKSGKTNALMFLVGQAMRELKGRAKAETVKEELEKLLK